MKKTVFTVILYSLFSDVLISQNSMTGDGFGGRLWYKPYNYSLGSISAYAICGNDNQLYGWGNQGLGLNFYDSKSSIPIPVKNMNHTIFCSAGRYLAGIKADRSAWLWGNCFGTDSVPYKILDSVKFVCAGAISASFVKMDGTVWSAGRESRGYRNGIGPSGAFGTGYELLWQTAEDRNIYKMANVQNAVRVAVNSRASVVLLSDGTLMTAGGFRPKNDSVQCTPIRIDGIDHVVDIKANTYSFIALNDKGEVYAWGDGYNGTLGDSSFDTHETRIPRKIKNLKNIVAISGSDNGECFLALDSDHVAYFWGILENEHTNKCKISSFPVVLDTGINDILAGQRMIYVIKRDGKLLSMGAQEVKTWLNLKPEFRTYLVELNPQISPLNLCDPAVMPVYKYDRYVLCQDEKLKLRDKSFDVQGLYSDTVNGNGRDTVYFIDLIYRKKSYSVTNKSICHGDSFYFSGKYYTENGRYTDTFINRAGCDSMAALNLHIIPKQYSESRYICPDDTIHRNGMTYTVNDEFTDSLKNRFACDSIVTYRLLADSNIYRCKEAEFYIPNAFSPDKNQINDVFKVYGLNILRIEMEIYNRWGELIFRENSSSPVWDGTYKSETCQDGVYLYHIVITSINRRKHYVSGMVNLLR